MIEKAGIPIHTVYESLYKENENIFNNQANYLIPKGRRVYAYSDCGIIYREIPIKEGFEEIYGRIYGDLMTGKEFYGYVDRGSIIDYDGSLGAVYVDGYKSNLGLTHKDFCQGGFIVNGKTWLELCDDYEILVEWCNR